MAIYISEFSETLFNSPQGICWMSAKVLAVCDTNNHAVRTIHLDEGRTEIFAGTGEQAAHGDRGIYNASIAKYQISNTLKY